MAPPVKYSSYEEKIKAYKKQQNNYSEKKWKCDTCDCIIRLGNKTNHLQSSKHISNLNGIKLEYSCAGGKKMWRCELCKMDMQQNSKYNHLKTSKHGKHLTATLTVNDQLLKLNPIVEGSGCAEPSEPGDKFESSVVKPSELGVEPSELNISDEYPSFEQIHGYRYLSNI